VQSATADPSRSSPNKLLTVLDATSRAYVCVEFGSSLDTCQNVCMYDLHRCLHDIDTSGNVGSPAGTWDMGVLQVKLDAVIRSRIGPRKDSLNCCDCQKGRRICHPHDLRSASAGRCTLRSAACTHGRATTCAEGLYVLLLAHRIEPAWPGGVARRDSVATGLQSRTRTTSQARAVYFSP
jgi:hypothetical protein